MSFARGGLSNVWGAAMLPNNEADFEGWPFNLNVIAPHYTAVANLVKIAGRRDNLEICTPIMLLLCRLRP